MESINFPGKTGTAGLDQSYKPLHYQQGPVEGMPGVICTHTRWQPSHLELGLIFAGAPINIEYLGDGAIIPLRAEVDPALCEPRTDRPPFHFSYRNYRGEVSWRAVRPIAIWWGHTDYHPDDQWMLKAFDMGKGEVRDFAWKDVSSADDLSRKAEAWIKRVMPLLNKMVGDGLLVDDQEDPIDLWNAGYDLFQLPSVLTLQGNIDEAVSTAVLRPATDADRLREILHDLVGLISEEQAIGGGPGFKDRHAKTVQEAVEILGLEG